MEGHKSSVSGPIMRFPCRVVRAHQASAPTVTHGERSTWGTESKCEARALSVQLSSRQESYAVHGFQGHFQASGRPGAISWGWRRSR